MIVTVPVDTVMNVHIKTMTEMMTRKSLLKLVRMSLTYLRILVIKPSNLVRASLIWLHLIHYLIRFPIKMNSKLSNFRYIPACWCNFGTTSWGICLSANRIWRRYWRWWYRTWRSTHGCCFWPPSCICKVNGFPFCTHLCKAIWTIDEICGRFF